jgi:adenylosuccinate lyase
MITRYTLPEMEKLWSDESRLARWLKVELLICEGWHRIGMIPNDAIKLIRENASLTLGEVEEIEKRTGHDLAAFVESLGKSVGEAARFVHYGVTSSDVVDTALSLAVTEALDMITQKAADLSTLLKEKAIEHKHTMMVGRTHGMHAEPTTLGLKLLLWHHEIERHLRRFTLVREDVAVGKISGAVGTFATVDPRVEEHVCRRLGLEPAYVSSQILQRDRHASYITALALAAGTVEKMAVEIRHLQRTEVGEVQEGFGEGRKGSSAMPHKRNPVAFEQLCGLCRIVRGNVVPALENIALWHERDITHSSVERVIIPDSSILLDYILTQMALQLRKLVVHPQRMLENLERTRGLIFSQRVLLALIDRGVNRAEAYALVQEKAGAALDEGKDFRDELRADPRVKALLSKEELEDLFDYGFYLRRVDGIFARALS